MDNGAGFPQGKRMRKDARELLWKWYRRSLVAQLAHYNCAALYARLHYYLGFPAIILTTIVGSSIFASINNSSPEADSYKWGFGSLSILAASLGAAQTFLRFMERAEHHRNSAVRYSNLKRKIEHYLVFEPDDLQACIETIRNDWDTLTGDCPILPQSIFHDSERRVYKQKGIADSSVEPVKAKPGPLPDQAVP